MNDEKIGTAAPAPTEHRLSILLSAYACQPDLTSEPGVGWNTALQMSEDHDIWVITSEEHRPYILENDAHQRMKWIFVDVPKFLTFWRSGERGRRIHYYLWQIWAYHRVKKLSAHQHFNVIHHITYVSYWTPSFLALLPIPFLWGPVGGAEATLEPFLHDLSRSSQLKERLRNTARAIAERFDIYVGKTARRAAIGLATTPETADKLRQLGTRDVRIYTDVALPDSLIETLVAVPIRQNPQPIRFISLGRLIGWKGYHLSIRAFALLEKNIDCEYWLLGTGAEKDRLKQLAIDSGVGDKIRFLDFVPHSEIPLRLAECDILLHPSLHDSGGWTCLEALAAARPVICLDIGGPATNVTADTGIKIPAITPEETIQKLAQAMRQLALDDELRENMGIAGRNHIIANYTWAARRKQFGSFYNEISRLHPQ